MISIVSGGINGLPICIQIAPGKIYAMSMSTLPRVEPFQGALKSSGNGLLGGSPVVSIRSKQRLEAWDASIIGRKDLSFLAAQIIFLYFWDLSICQGVGSCNVKR